MVSGVFKKRRDDRREEKIGRDLRSRFTIRMGVESKIRDQKEKNLWSLQALAYKNNFWYHNLKR